MKSIDPDIAQRERMVSISSPAAVESLGKSVSTRAGHSMTIHKRILEWQAAHPTITWIVWGIIWIIVLVLLFRPSSTSGG